jgi:hypothetical protein
MPSNIGEMSATLLITEVTLIIAPIVARTCLQHCNNLVMLKVMLHE